MSKDSRHPGVLVGVDGSPGSGVALRWAARDAELRNVPLTLVHVVPPTAGNWRESSNLPAWMRVRRERGHRLLEEARRVVDENAGRPLVNVSSQMPSAHAVSALVDLYKDADLLVAGCLGTGTLRGRHLGSVSFGLTHYAHCPVAVIHDGTSLDFDAAAPVLVGIDGSPGAQAAAAIAFDEAVLRGVGVVAMHAWKDVNVFDSAVSFADQRWPALHAKEEEVLDEQLAPWLERYPNVPVRRVIVRDEPAKDPRGHVGFGSAGRGRQPRQRRIRWNAAGLGQRGRRVVGPGPCHRGTVIGAVAKALPQRLSPSRQRSGRARGAHLSWQQTPR
jgi:nucleotide-binding universal stress UspA family protein